MTNGSQLFNAGPGTFEDNLWNEADVLTRDRVLALAEAHQTVPHFALTMLPRHCDASPLDVMKRYGHHFGEAEVVYSSRQSGAGVARLSTVSRRVTTLVACVPGGIPNVWLLYTTAKSQSPEYGKLLRPLLDKLSTKIKPGWVSSRQLERALIAFEGKSGGKLTPRRVASRAFDRSTIDYLRAPTTLDKVIIELAETEHLLHSLEFMVTMPRGRCGPLSAGVNRSLKAVYHRGDARMMDQFLIADQLEPLLAAHFGLVSVNKDGWGRERVVFRFENDEAIKSSESHHRLAQALAQNPRLSVCAVHLNPYLDLSVLDLADASSMNVMTGSGDRLFVVPGPRCTSAAVSTLLAAVYTHFAAGYVLETSEEDENTPEMAEGA